MRRGDVVIVQALGTPASKARPCAIVHRAELTGRTAKVTVCPLTSHQPSAPLLRPSVPPTVENGLKEVSSVEADWVFTVRTEKVKSRIGVLDARAMAQIDDALRRWLDL